MVGKAASAGSREVEARLAAIAEPLRSALEHLRKTIRSAAPDAEEAIVYGAPGFRQDGGLVCYNAKKGALSFFPMSPPLLDAMGDEVTPWRASKGTLEFTPDNPLPDALVKKIVVARLAENRAKTKG